MSAQTQYEFLVLVQRVHDEALPKFNWGASALDANAIGLLNQFGLQLPKALAEAKKLAGK